MTRNAGEQQDPCWSDERNCTLIIPVWGGSNIFCDELDAFGRVA
jgi:hypothetical protein